MALFCLSVSLPSSSWKICCRVFPVWVPHALIVWHESKEAIKIHERVYAAVHVTDITAQPPSLRHATWVRIVIYFTVLHNNGQSDSWVLKFCGSLCLHRYDKKAWNVAEKDSLFASHANRQTGVVDGCRDEDHTAFSGGNQALFLLMPADLVAADGGLNDFRKAWVCAPPTTMSFFFYTGKQQWAFGPRESLKPWVRFNANG